jgi:toxin-antitoxin system PIN domain toxin
VTTFLLDVNVLIALIDPAHVGHEAAHRWFEAQGRKGWATCPLTENGVIRIVSHPNYPGAPASPAAVVAIVAELRSLAGHIFWPDDISLVGTEQVEAERILTSGQVTDSYLLALAVAHDGHLATFDRRISTKAVKGGKAAMHLINGQ